MKPTDYSTALALQLEKMFGGADSVPAELKSHWFMIHARLQEVEQEIELLMKKAGAHQAAPPVAGDETGDF